MDIFYNYMYIFYTIYNIVIINNIFVAIIIIIIIININIAIIVIV